MMRESPPHDVVVQIVRDTFVQHVDWFPELPSTNSRALELAAESAIALPRLVWTERQTAGRGRGANVWWSSEGALTFSLLIDGPAEGLPPSCWPQVSMVTAIAVAEALAQFVPDDRIGLKWPNDVQLDGRKVCGILVEAAPGNSGRLVIGVGLNVRNSLRQAPPELQAQAVSLADVLSAPPPISLVLLEFLNAWRTATGELSAGRLDLAERWLLQCVLSHEPVRLTRGETEVEGICRGITRDGALLLEVCGRLEPHWAGTVRKSGQSRLSESGSRAPE